MLWIAEAPPVQSCTVATIGVTANGVESQSTVTFLAAAQPSTRTCKAARQRDPSRSYYRDAPQPSRESQECSLTSVGESCACTSVGPPA